MGSYKTDFEAEENNDRFRGWTGAREARPATSFTTAQHQNSECFPSDNENLNSEASYQSQSRESETTKTPLDTI